MKLNFILPVLTVLASSLAFTADSEITSSADGGLRQSQQTVHDDLDGHWLADGVYNEPQRPTHKPKVVNNCATQSCNRTGFDEVDDEGNTVIWVPADEEYQQGLKDLGIVYVGKQEAGFRQAKLTPDQWTQKRKCENGTIRDIRIGKGKGHTVAKIHHYYVTDQDGQLTGQMEAKIEFRKKSKVEKHFPVESK